MTLKNVIALNVDLKDPTRIEKPVVTQNDSVVFVLHVFDRGQPYDLSGATTISLANIRRDGSVVVTPGTKFDNEATFEIQSNETAIVGDVNAKAQFYDAEGRVSTLKFKYAVEHDPTGSSYIPSASEQTLIQTVLADGPLRIQEAINATGYANTQGDYAKAQGDYVVAKKPMIDKFTGEQTNLQTQLDTLIIENGTSDAEVLQARGTYPLVKDRLNSVDSKLADIAINAKTFGAIADGLSHPLSERFSTLVAAQNVYPHATALTDEIDWCAIQGAIDYAKKIGVSRRPSTQPRSDLGMEVSLPSGNFIINKPLIMPRGGNYAGYSVSLCGANETSVIIKGTTAFVSGRALIEWEQIALRTYYPTIKNVVLVPPDIEGVKCIYYKVTDKSDVALIYDEYINYGTFENIVCEGSNGFHEVSIDLEGLARNSIFKNIRANYAKGVEKYSTILIRTEKELGQGGGNSASIASIFYENQGIGFSKFERIDGSSPRGGWCTVFEGRLMNCEWTIGLAGNGTIPLTNKPSFNFTNCGNVTLNRFYTEGRAEKPQYRFENCQFVKLDGVWMGSPDYPENPSNGIEMINCQDCIVQNRPKVPASPDFGDYGGKTIILDANSKRNKFLNFQIKGTFASEVTDLGIDNYFELYDVSTNKAIVVGGSREKKAVGLFSATNSALQSIPSNVLTKVVFDLESYDTDNWYNPIESKFTPKKTGYYRITSSLRHTGNGDNVLSSLTLFKNGTNIAYLNRVGGDASLFPQMGGSYVAYANGSTDFFEIYTFSDNTVSTNIPISSLYNYFQAEYIGS